MKGDLHSVRILRKGDASEAAKDKLGRIPSDLQPEGFGRSPDIDFEMYSPGNDTDEQVALRGQFSALALDEYDDLEHGNLESEGDASNAEPAGITVNSFADVEEGGGSGRYQIAPGFNELVIERPHRILPSPPFDSSNDNASGIPCEAALKSVHLSTRLINAACGCHGGSMRNTVSIKWVRMISWSIRPDYFLAT